MNYIDILRTKPYLKPCNVNNICNRVLMRTKQNAFVVFNNVQQNYELHTVEAYILSGDSYNTTLPLDFLNEALILDYLSQNFSTNLTDIVSTRQRQEQWAENWRNERRPRELEQQMKVIERVMGTHQ